MITNEQLEMLMPLACDWAEQQERFILKNGVPLTDEQQVYADIIGIKEVKKVRLMKVNRIPTPSHPQLKSAAEMTGLISPGTAGITFRYGIYVRAEYWDEKSLVIHELAHTLQYERFGSFKRFL